MCSFTCAIPWCLQSSLLVSLSIVSFIYLSLITHFSLLFSIFNPPSSSKATLDTAGRTPHQRRDHISHFILRLAYCRTEDLRRWFLQHECLLLRFRVGLMTAAEFARFMNLHGLAEDKLSGEDKEMRKENLVGLSGVTELNFHGTEFYRVPFQQALTLISSRGVYLEGGLAIVPVSKLVATVVNRFRIHLSRALMEAAQLFDHVSGDTRIGPLLKNMNKQYVGKDFTKTGGSSAEKLTPELVDEAAENNMPLCMKTLHNNLKKDHKLKHWGRLQYGLFLKVCAMKCLCIYVYLFCL